MKMNFKKFMAVGLVASAMVSCSDDLGLNQGNGAGQDADLTATLAGNAFTRVGVKEVDGNPQNLVFTAGDKIRVFTSAAMTFNEYDLTSGAGSTNATFSLVTKQALPEGEKKFAITDADLVYGVTPNSEGKGVLTMTIPEEYTPTFVDGVAKFPAPFWGVCTETGTSPNIKLNVSLTPLTAFLRVDISELPEGTNKIVLTTHGGENMIHDNTDHFAATGVDPHQEGFQLASTMPASDTNKGWTESTDVQWITGGKSEALSGTFNTTLEDGKFLDVDSRLVHSDVLTVDITKLPADSKIFYVPIVAKKYQDLFVLAVKGTSKYSYRWAGQILKEYKDFEFKGGLFYSLQMNMINLGTVDQNTLNQEIAKANLEEGRLTVMNVEKLVADDGVTDNPLFAASKIDVVGSGNLELNLFTIDDLTGKLTDGKLLVTDLATTSTAASKVKKMGKDIFHTAYINVPKDFKTYQLNLNMQSTNVEFGTVDNENASDDLIVNIWGAASKFVSGTNAVNMTTGELYDEKDAAIFIRNGVGTVNVMESTKGDIYVYNGTETIQTEISKALNVLATEGNSIRITDALVNTLALKKNADSNTKQHYVMTTGSAAMQAVIAYKDGNKWDGSTMFTTKFANKIPGEKPNNAILYSYYTGSGLSDYAWTSGYDCGTVYTVAQLQSLGEKKRSNTEWSYNGYTEEFTSTTTDVAGHTEVAKYVIPKELVSLMWLGDKHYPWLGANVTVDNFILDGETTSLRNLNMDLSGTAGTKFYLDDPHLCCTSCTTPKLAGTKGAVAIESNIGLIRSIINKEATVTRVNLNDVKFVAPAANIPNVGAIVGSIESDGKVSLTENYVGEPKIDMGGNNVAGMFGRVINKEGGSVELTAKNNEVKGTRTDNGLYNTVKGKNNVGGMFGDINVQSVKANDNKVTLKGDIVASGSYGAGLAAKSFTKAASDYDSNTVDVQDITAKNSYAAGLVGELIAEDATGLAITLVNDKVKANNISTEGQYAAGLVGYLKDVSGTAPDKGYARVTSADVDAALISSNEFAGGVVAQSNLGKSRFRLNSADVKVTEISATEGFVGGELGQSVEGEVAIGGVKSVDTNFITNIDVEKLNGAYSVGGLVGNNKSDVNVFTGTWTKDSKDYVASIAVDITEFANAEKPDSYYEGDFTQTQRAGTMSNIVGMTSGNVAITETAQLVVTDHLNSAMKIAVKYKLHSDETHNLAEDASQKYWGDYNGYVGWNGTGVYSINGVNQKGDAEGTGCNLWKFDNTSEYDANSKLVD